MNLALRIGGQALPVRQFRQPLKDMVFLAFLCVHATRQYHFFLYFYLESLELHYPGAVGTMPVSLKLLIG